MSSLKDRSSGERYPVSRTHDFALILVLCMAGFVTSAVAATHLATDNVVICWCNPP